MTDTPQQQADQIKLQLRTRHVPTSALGQHITALLRLNEAVLVIRDTSNAWSLSVARVIAAENSVVSMEFDRLRPLSITEVSIARQHGAGVFEPPAPPPEIPDAG